MDDRIKLAKAMGLEIYSRGADTYPLRKLHNNLMQPFTPFTDANDERAVLRFMSTKPFSVRRRFFNELDRLVQNRLKIKEHAAWPEAMIFIQDGDIAHAALEALESVPGSES